MSRSTRTRRGGMAPARASRGISAVTSVARSSREGAAPVAPRVAIAGIFGAVLVGVLVLRLWALTVIGGAEYAERADSNVIRKLPVVAPRGSILDRDGRRIVVNREMRQVVLDLQDVEGERRDAVIEELGRVLAPNRFEVAKTTEEIRDAVENAAPGQVEPVVVARDVRQDAVVHYLAEHQSDFPGVDVRDAYTRDYVQGTTAAHILGQVSAVSEADLEAYPNLSLIDRIGVSGLEKEYDQYLRGTNGYDAVMVDAAGVRSDAGLRGLPPTPGRNLRTTIDLKVQVAGERALAASIARVQRTAEGRDARAGAFVAIDPNTGEVLALGSFPTFDPNWFVQPGRANARKVERLVDPDNRRAPMLNRAMSGTYPAGSTFKAITAIAAMEEGYAKPDTPIGCPPSMDILGTKFPNNTDRHLGAIDVRTALEVSCNTYFYKLALHFYNDPGSPLQAWASRFGLGTATGIDVPGEADGLVPTPEWKDNVESDLWSDLDRVWKPGDSVNLSIGQGDLKVTPLQMANAYATIGNGGTVYTPHLVKGIEEQNGRVAVAIPPKKARTLDLDPFYLAAVREGLGRVNTGGNGTATAVFGTFEQTSAGKTGTAEKNRQTDIAWYCGYAPAEAPTIAACAFVDGGGHGGTAAAPVVLRLFQEWFGAEGGNAAGGGAAD